MVKYFLCLKISLSVVFGLFSLKSLQQNNDAIPARNVKILLVLNVSSIDIKLLIMELDIQMLKCMAAYLKKREHFQTAAYWLDYIIKLTKQLYLY